MKKQSEAVYEATRAVLKENEIVFEDGQDVKPLVNDDMKKSIVDIVMEGLKTGKVALRDGYDHSKLPTYTKGMVANWFRKDSRLNGGVKHKVANPGIRAGSSDLGVKEMRKLLKIHKTPENGVVDKKVVAKIEAAIDAKIKSIKLEKARKIIDVDVNHLPDDLKDLVPEES